MRDFELRPCLIRHGDKLMRAVFHMWETVAVGGHPEGQISTVLAIVEYEDGIVDEVEPRRIRFIDDKIKNYLDDVKEKTDVE